jgi:hypothetical protein
MMDHELYDASANIQGQESGGLPVFTSKEVLRSIPAASSWASDFEWM